MIGEAALHIVSEEESSIRIDPLDLVFFSTLALGAVFLAVMVQQQKPWRVLLPPFLLIVVGLTGLVITFAILPAFQSSEALPETVHVQLWPGFYKPLSEQTLGYVPQNITVVWGVNSTVAWDNGDSELHTAHSDTEEFNTGVISSQMSKSHAFIRPGVFTYHCDFHTWRTGKVIVVEGG